MPSGGTALTSAATSMRLREGAGRPQTAPARRPRRSPAPRRHRPPTRARGVRSAAADARAACTPKRLPVWSAAFSATSVPLAAGQQTRGTELRRQHAGNAAHRPVPPSITTRLPVQVGAVVLLHRGLDAGHHRRGRGVRAARVGHQRDHEGRHHRCLARSSMSAASSASRPPMKMPVRATPLGPREKIASCVRPVTRRARPRNTASGSGSRRRRPC
jgi:hypothetical protein